MAADEDRDEGCCGIFFLKGVLVVFNFFFGLFGAGLVGVSLWTLTDKSAYTGVMQSSVYSATAYILLGTGLCVILLAIMGCTGAVRELRCLLMTYGLCLMVVFVLEAIAAVLAFIYSQTVHLELVRTFNMTLTREYRFTERVTKSIDRLQADLKCCGSDGYRDWRQSQWFLDKNLNTDELELPDSCCKTVTLNCGVSSHPSNIHEKGCVKKLEVYLREHLFILGCIATAIAILEIVGILFSCCLVRQLHLRRLRKRKPKPPVTKAPLLPPAPPPQPQHQHQQPPHSYLPPPNYPYSNNYNANF